MKTFKINQQIYLQKQNNVILKYILKKFRNNKRAVYSEV